MKKAGIGPWFLTGLTDFLTLLGLWGVVDTVDFLGL